MSSDPVLNQKTYQTALYPMALRKLVDGLKHRPRWRFELGNVARDTDSDGNVIAEGLTLSIYITEPDAYHEGKMRSVVHYFPVPPATYDERSWQRWLFERCGDVDTHERMEAFTINGVKPYAPSHGPGNDPYMVREIGTELDVKTAFTGEINV